MLLKNKELIGAKNCTWVSLGLGNLGEALASL
jgi:hypothetical protein